jgi:2-polyprenyl-6-methoxyphenol hydroxylase-like FAD-dependent oxidoreductase
VTTHVLISGASIAGPALAHWLHRFGFRTTVVERSPVLRPGGQAIDVRGIAKEVVRRMGLDAEVRAACTETTGVTYVTGNNRPVVTMGADLFDGDGFIAEIEILRGDLAEVLYRATEDSTEYLFGDRIESLEQESDGVSVHFANGSRRRFDLVVGADGLHSGVRTLAFGPDADRLRHLGFYLSFWTVPNHLGLDRRVVSYSEPGRSLGVRAIRDNTEAMAYFGFRSESLDYDHRDVRAQRAIVREQMAGMRWEAPRLLAELEHAPDFYFDACAQVVLDRWSTGRVALIGDAAFCPSPMSGQGTSLALVAAYVLAGELAAHSGDHGSAFAAYEQRLRRFVAANQELGRKQARSMATTSRFGVAVQYATVLAMVHLPGASLVMRRLMRAVGDIELPDYPVPGPVSA